jgi:hypothetical protein
MQSSFYFEAREISIFFPDSEGGCTTCGQQWVFAARMAITGAKFRTQNHSACVKSEAALAIRLGSAPGTAHIQDHWFAWALPSAITQTGP